MLNCGRGIKYKMATIRLNKINGVLYPPFINQSRIDGLRTYALLNDDLFIVSYPKSGTTWMQQIVRSIKSRGDLDVPLATAIPWLEGDGEEACRVYYYLHTVCLIKPEDRAWLAIA